MTGDFLVTLHESRAMIAARVGLLRGSFRRTALYPFRVAHRNFPKSWKGSDKGKCKTLPTIQQVPERRVLARQRHRIALTGIHKFCGGLGRGLPAPAALTSNRDNYPAIGRGLAGLMLGDRYTGYQTKPPLSQQWGRGAFV